MGYGISKQESWLKTISSDLTRWRFLFLLLGLMASRQITIGGGGSHVLLAMVRSGTRSSAICRWDGEIIEKLAFCKWGKEVPKIVCNLLETGNSYRYAKAGQKEEHFGQPSNPMSPILHVINVKSPERKSSPRQNRLMMNKIIMWGKNSEELISLRSPCWVLIFMS